MTVAILAATLVAGSCVNNAGDERTVGAAREATASTSLISAPALPSAPTTTVFTSAWAPDGTVVAPGPADVLAGASNSGAPAAPVAIAYGAHKRQTIDLYLPDGEGPHPVLVFFHSGGWIEGSHDDVLAIIAANVSDGWAVASAAYRLAPEVRFPTPITDAKHAVRHLKAHGHHWGLDTELIVASGYSAGGHLAAMVGATVGDFEPFTDDAALNDVDSSVDAVVSFAAPVDLVSFGTALWLGTNSVELLLDCHDPRDGVLHCDELAMHVANPAVWARGAPDRAAHLPPAYIAHGALDPLVLPDGNAAALVEAWRAGGGVAWYDLVDDRGHLPLEDRINFNALRAFLTAVRNGQL